MVLIDFTVNLYFLSEDLFTRNTFFESGNDESQPLSLLSMLPLKDLQEKSPNYSSSGMMCLVIYNGM